MFKREKVWANQDESVVLPLCQMLGILRSSPKDQRCGFLGELPAFLLRGEGRSGLWSPSQPWRSLHDAGKVKTAWIYGGQWSVKGNPTPFLLPAPSTGKTDPPAGHLLICHKRGPGERWQMVLCQTFSHVNLCQNPRKDGEGRVSDSSGTREAGAQKLECLTHHSQ